jgi:SAM-dependent methyltransferase
MKTERPKMFQKMQIYSPRFHCRFRNMMKFAKKEFGGRKNISILDAGCGTGTLMLMLEKMGYRPDGFDIHQENIQVVESRTNAFVERGDVLTYKPRKKYDLVFCGEVLEHIEDDQKAMNNLRKMLKRGGLLLISVPNDPAQWNYEDDLGGHKRRYTKAELEKKMGLAGFSDFHSRYIGWPLIKKFMYGKKFLDEKDKFQREPSPFKKLLLRLFCQMERIDDLFDTERADKIVMSAKAL